MHKEIKPVSAAEMRALDEQAIHGFNIPGLILMENAGRSVAQELLRMTARKIVIFAGRGNNGGDGFVVARHLHNHGRTPFVMLLAPRADIKGDAATHLEMLERIGVSVSTLEHPDEAKHWLDAVSLKDTDAVVDAIFGTGLSRAVAEPHLSAIEKINELAGRGLPVVSIDLPSGLHADTGEILGVCVRAAKTVTLGRPKHGLYLKEGPAHAGEIVLGDISLPRALITT